MERIRRLQPVDRIRLLGANAIDGLHARPEGDNVFLTIRGVLGELGEQPPAEKLREVVLFDRRLERCLAVQAIVTSIQNRFPDFIAFLRVRRQQGHDEARPRGGLGRLGEALEEILEPVVPNRATVLLLTGRIWRCSVVRPHQELVDEDERSAARGFHLAEYLGPERVRRRRVEIRFGFIARQNIQSLLAEKLPGDEIPRHAEAALLSCRRHNFAALYPVHLVERDGGHSGDRRVRKLGIIQNCADGRFAPWAGSRPRL